MMVMGNEVTVKKKSDDVMTIIAVIGKCERSSQGLFKNAISSFEASFEIGIFVGQFVGSYF
jgi:hypothetical protein